MPSPHWSELAPFINWAIPARKRKFGAFELQTRKFRICKYLYRDADPRKGSVTSEEKLRLVRCRIMHGYAGKCLRIRARHRTAALALDNACSSLRS